MTIFICCFLSLWVFADLTPGCQLGGRGELEHTKLERYSAILRTTPDQAAVRFNMALDYAHAGNGAKALSLLQQALADKPWLDPSSEPGFHSLTHCEAFQEAVLTIQTRYSEVASSHLINVVLPKDLIPEGIASDPVDGTLYVSSIFHRKIVKIDPGGHAYDFVAEARDGLLGVLGLRVDPRDRTVWAATALRGNSALVHFAREGRMLGRYAPTERQRHEFNDLVVTSSGDVLVTDDLDNAVYRLTPGTKHLERIGLQGRRYPNGIALSLDGTSVYVAYDFGIVMLDPDHRQILEIDKPGDISLAQIDGLYLRNNSLIAIQNGFGRNRIVEFKLSMDGKRITGGKLLEYRSANVTLPTTGTVYDDKFYYIVNTQVDHEKDGELLNPATLEPVRIAVLRLN